MSAHDLLMRVIKEYFIELGYSENYIADFFSAQNFKEIAAIRLANANVMIKNKSDHSSHQTHIAITGEMIDFFCPWKKFRDMNNKEVLISPVDVSLSNLRALKNIPVSPSNALKLDLIEGRYSWGKRTQNQLQLSKKNSFNSDCFNELRLGLYENDLLVMLKYRSQNKILAIGIPQTFYLDILPGFCNNYETNTYLRIPYRG